MHPLPPACVYHVYTATTSTCLSVSYHRSTSLVCVLKEKQIAQRNELKRAMKSPRGGLQKSIATSNILLMNGKSAPTGPLHAHKKRSCGDGNAYAWKRPVYLVACCGKFGATLLSICERIQKCMHCATHPRRHS